MLWLTQRSRWRSKKSLRESSPESSLSSTLSEGGTDPYPNLEFETWLLDFSSNRTTELLPSADWLFAKMKTIKKDHDVWSHFARLRPHWRNRIFAFLEIRRDEDPGWTLYYLEVPQKWSRTRIFGQRRDEQLIQLILCRRRMSDQESDLLRERSKIEGPGSGLPKRVSFAGDLEEAGTEKGVHTISDHASQKKASEISEQIARLEEKRNGLARSGLGTRDYERIADLEDMIIYLRDQLKSEATRTNVPNMTTFHDEHQSDPMRTGASRAPVIIREDRIPNSGREDEVIVEEYSYDRDPSPIPARRTVYEDTISVPNRYPRNTHNDWEIMRRETSPGKTDYEGRYGVRNNSRHGVRERQRSDYEEEDLIVIPRDRERSSQGGWQERSRSRPRPARQDSVGTRGEPIVIRRDRSWERSKSRPSRQLSQETDYYDDYERRRVGDDDIGPRRRTEEEVYLPRRQEIVIRGNGTSKPRPRDRQYTFSSESEHSYNGSRTRRRRPALDTSDQSKALVLRAGASRLPYDYLKERVSNAGIRVRGDDDIGSPPPESVISQDIRENSRLPTLRRNSYRDRRWAPGLRRRLSERLHDFDSMEDEVSRYQNAKMNEKDNGGPVTELSDAEVIAQTLKQYTTIQDSDLPVTGVSAPTRTKVEVGPSALKNASYASPGPERTRSLPVPGRKARFEQDNGLPQPDREEQSKATNEGSKAVDEGPFMDIISEEPDVMNDIPHHERVVYFPERPTPSSPQQRRSFPDLPDLTSREASPRPQSRDSSLDYPRDRPSHGTIIIDGGGSVMPGPGETPNHTAREESYDEDDINRTVSRKPTVDDD